MSIEPTITLDIHNLHNLETPNGGFTRATTDALDIPYPPRKGWLTGLIGKTIPEAQYIKAWRSRLISAGEARRQKREKLNFNPEEPDAKTFIENMKHFS